MYISMIFFDMRLKNISDKEEYRKKHIFKTEHHAYALRARAVCERADCVRALSRLALEAFGDEFLGFVQLVPKKATCVDRDRSHSSLARLWCRLLLVEQHRAANSVMDITLLL
jgi:hypothetical protein